MNRACFVILARARQWRLLVQGGPDGELAAVDLPASGEAIDRQAAEGIRQVMAEHGYGGGGALLAIASQWSLAATISTDGIPRHGRHEALTYRLEEHLPLAAEEVVADFVECGDQALGVASERCRLRKILTELESASIAIHTVAPTAALALQQFSETHIGRDLEYALVGLDGNIELGGFRGGRIRCWQTAQNADFAVRTLQAALLAAPAAAEAVPVALAAVDQGVTAAVARIPGVEPRPVDGFDAEAAAAQTAAGILSGKSKGWFDLRRGELAAGDRLRPIRRPLSVCAALVLTLLCAATAGLLWRARRYQAATEAFGRGQAAVFERILPNERQPLAVRSRLASHARQLAGLRGASADVPDRPSALETLRQACARLPGDVRMRVVDLSVEPNGVRMSGQARSHGEAEKIAAELRKGNVLDVQSPRSDKLVSGGVAFTLSASLVAVAGKEADQ